MEGVSKMSTKKATKIDRRKFLRSAGVGAAGAAAVGLSAGKVSAASPDPASSKGAGYQETEHVKKFYELSRV